LDASAAGTRGACFVVYLDVLHNDACGTFTHLALTMASISGEDDPFRDPSLASAAPQPRPSAPQNIDVPNTLAVGRNASLTLGTDSLIVLGKRKGLYRRRCRGERVLTMGRRGPTRQQRRGLLRHLSGRQ